MNVNVIGNFGVETGSIVPSFSGSGNWYEFFSGDTLKVTSVDDPIELKAGEFRIYTTKKLSKPETGLGLTESLPASGLLNLKVYPNPARENFTLEFQLTKTSMVNVELSDISGRRLASFFQGKLNTGKQQLTVNIPESITPGIYFVQVGSNNGNAVSKLIIK